MTDTTLDEARRCPRCNELGNPAGQRKLDRRHPLDSGGTLHIFRCANTRCKRYGRDWIVQVRPDGTIPEPTLNRDKTFRAPDGVDPRERIERAQQYADEMNRATEIPNYR